MATIKGQAPCPECGSEQNVMHDGRKYYISCQECRTFTNYQNKASHARILGKMKTPEIKEEPKEAPKAIPEEALTPRPNKEASSGKGFFDFLDVPIGGFFGNREKDTERGDAHKELEFNDN